MKPSYQNHWILGQEVVKLDQTAQSSLDLTFTKGANLPKVVYYQDASEDRLWRYRVVADNNEIVHASHKGWSSRSDAWVYLLALRHELNGHINHFEVLRDRSGTGGGTQCTETSTLEVANWEATDNWRWKICGEALIGKSHEGFERKEGCVHNLQLLRAILNSDYDEVVEPHHD